MFRQEDAPQLAAQMRQCYADELALYEKVRELVGRDLSLTSLLTRAVDNLRVAESDDIASDEVHLLFARFTFVQMYSMFQRQLREEGVNLFEEMEIVVHRLISFMAFTPQEELEYLFQGHYEDASLTQLMGV